MRFSYRNDLSQLDKLAGDLESFGEAHGVNPAIIHAFNLCLDEIVTNIISYGFDDGANHAIQLDLSVDDRMATAVVADTGKPFNPLTDAKEPDLEADLEDREIGGLGIFFLKQMMDELEYAWEDGHNRLTMRKLLQIPA